MTNKYFRIRCYMRLQDSYSIDVNYYEDVYTKKKLNDDKFGLHPELLHDRNKLRRIRNQKTFLYRDGVTNT